MACKLIFPKSLLAFSLLSFLLAQVIFISFVLKSSILRICCNSEGEMFCRCGFYAFHRHCRTKNAPVYWLIGALVMPAQPHEDSGDQTRARNRNSGNPGKAIHFNLFTLFSHHDACTHSVLINYRYTTLPFVFFSVICFLKHMPSLLVALPAVVWDQIIELTVNKSTSYRLYIIPLHHYNVNYK